MQKGLNQTLAWVLAIFLSGGIFAGVVFLLVKSHHDPFAARSHSDDGQGESLGDGKIIRADDHHDESAKKQEVDGHAKKAAHGKQEKPAKQNTKKEAAAAKHHDEEELPTDDEHHEGGEAPH